MASPPAVASRQAALGTSAAVTAVVSWGIGPVVVKLVDVPAMAVSFYRLTLGAALTVVVLYASGRRLSRSALLAAIPGGVAFALDILLFFTAVKRTTVADATIITALQPALVLLVVGRLFGERVRRSDVAWTVLAIGGVVVVVSASGSVAGRSLTGDALATVALGAWTWYFVAAKLARRTIAALEYQAALAVVAAVVVAPVALLSGQHLGVTGGHAWSLLTVTIVMGACGHFLMNWAHAYTRLVTSSLLTLASPGVSVVAAALLLGEPILAVQVIGMAVVLGALGMVLWRTSREASSLARLPLATVPPTDPAVP